jgi:hypothetical protein
MFEDEAGREGDRHRHDTTSCCECGGMLLVLDGRPPVVGLPIKPRMSPLAKSTGAATP